MTVGAGAIESFDSDTGVQFITQNQLEGKTFGVFTKCDRLDEDHAEFLGVHIMGGAAEDGSQVERVEVREVSENEGAGLCGGVGVGGHKLRDA